MTYLILLAGPVLLLDQITKLLVFRLLPLFSVREIIPGFFNLVHVRNTGAAFSMFAGAPSFWRQIIFVGLTVVVVAGLLMAYTKLETDDRANRTAYALIISGALGNLIDRVRLGEVIDFLDFYVGSYHWPAFNVADMGISIGAGIMLLTLLKRW
jgi:signal peptidase II